MAVSPLYIKGYEAGYKKGLKDGLHGSAARTVMQNDLIHIYGQMAITLMERRHWKLETVEALIRDIQTEWFTLGDKAINCETMAEYVKRKTGIDLIQISADIVDISPEDVDHG